MNAVVPCTSNVPVGPERFTVVYSIQGDEDEARAKAIDICFEQTVEFPEALVPERLIREGVVGPTGVASAPRRVRLSGRHQLCRSTWPPPISPNGSTS